MHYLSLHRFNRDVAQLVARYVRDVEVGSSSLLIPTAKTSTLMIQSARFLYFETQYALMNRYLDTLSSSPILAVNAAPLKPVATIFPLGFNKTVCGIPENENTETA